MRFQDLGLSDPDLRSQLDDAYRRVLDSGWVGLGPEVAGFEREFAADCGVAHCVGVGNGLDAISLSLKAAGVGPGDEVIVPSHTFAATWIAVGVAGAKPVPVEIDPDTYMLDPAAVEAAVNARTAAILPVSLYGHPVEIGPLMAIAERHGLLVVEDAAQGHGSAWNGRRTGSVPHVTAFSFYPTKNLGAIGDAGAVVTNDPALADRVRMLRNYGSRERYEHEVIGFNSRLDELQAAFLRVQLPRLDDNNERRRGFAAAYGEALAEVADLALPVAAPWARHVYHLYVVRSPHRDALRAHLAEAGVETLIHYPRPCHLQGAFADLGYRRGDFPRAESMADQVLSLPLRPNLAPQDVEAVAAAIRAFRH